MIVLSVGMPRAGSGWHYNLIHDLMKTTGCADAQDIRKKYGLQKILTEVNCNIGVLSPRRLAMVTLPALMGNTFVIKAHAGPSSASRLLASLGLLRITYIYRDPRDAMGFVVNGIDVGTIGARFDGLYLPPPSRPDKPLSVKTLIVPTSEYSDGRSVVLMTGRSIYTVALRHLVEQRAEWSWATIQILEKKARV